MIIATGNNFGAGQIEFKEYLSDNMIILNGRFSFDCTKEEYLGDTCKLPWHNVT